jgi:hypothetical protein
MGADVLLGLQWGDEGKGKIVDFREVLMLATHLNLMVLNMFYTQFHLVYLEKELKMLLEMEL